MVLRDAREMLQNATRDLIAIRKREELMKQAAYRLKLNDARATFFEGTDAYYLSVKESIDEALGASKTFVGVRIALLDHDMDPSLLVGDTITECEYSRAFCENSGLFPEEFAIRIIEEKLGEVCIQILFTPPLQPPKVPLVQG